MKLSDFLDELGSPISYHAKLCKITGGVTATLLLCQLMYWRGKGRLPDGWIYKAQEELEEETGLTRREQETARKYLKERGLLEECKRGMPRILHYRINLDKLDELWAGRHSQSQSVRKRHAGLSEKDSPVCTKAPDYLYTETTSENTFKDHSKVNAIKAFPGKTPCAHEDEFQPNQNSQQVESSLSTPDQSDTLGKSRSPVEDKSSAALSEKKNAQPVLQDRWSSAQRQEQAFQAMPPWRTSRSPNGILSDFVKYIAGVYLPSTPHYQGKKVEMPAAKSWITTREVRQEYSLIEIQWEAFQESQSPSSGEVRSQSQLNPLVLAELAEMGITPEEVFKHA